MIEHTSPSVLSDVMNHYSWFVRDASDQFVREQAVELRGVIALQTAVRALRQRAAVDHSDETAEILTAIEGRVLDEMGQDGRSSAKPTYRYEGKEADAIVSALTDTASKVVDPSSPESYWTLASRDLLYKAGLLSRPDQTRQEPVVAQRTPGDLANWARQDMHDYDDPTLVDFVPNTGEPTTDGKVYDTNSRQFQGIVRHFHGVDADATQEFPL